ncbi:MAG: ABC transporter substrate-binding protein [Desulfovibrionaceae bacterium]
MAITDDLGREVRLAAPARRIVALYGAFNEMLAAMDLADRIVARTQADTLPPSIVALPVIGTHMRPNTELVVGLAPDLVLQMGGRSQATEAVAALERLGVPTACFEAGSFEALFGVIRRLGVLTAAPDRAEALIASMRARLDRVAEAVRAAPAMPRVFFEVRYPNLLAAGRGSIVSQVIQAAGGENCVEAPGRIARLNEEEALRLAPDAWLVQRGPMNPDPTPLADRPHFAALAAARSGRVLVVDEGTYSRPGPRLVDAVEELAAWLHPGLLPATGGPEEIQRHE